jgi:hypothetical protein
MLRIRKHQGRLDKTKAHVLKQTLPEFTTGVSGARPQLRLSSIRSFKKQLPIKVS